MGGGTSDVAVFQNGAISHTANIPTSGDHITKDIARALQTPSMQAEELKKKYGCASSSIIHENETIEVPGMAGRKNKIFSRMALASVIEQRYLDIFGLIKQKLNLSSLENNIPAGIVITGGTSRMEGVAQLAEEVFNTPVRIGSPSGLIGLSDILRNPIYATAVGLVLYSQKSQEEDHMNYLFMKDKNIFNKAFRWIQNNF
jgi:cell division protein FtsA